ncbi:MAG: hypothetical protein E4H02_11685 [Lentisphaerales bacterium]|nr:MAG: hypothetical protein E4H02_11685 [Lentisphaerales bacterium]
MRKRILNSTAFRTFALACICMAAPFAWGAGNMDSTNKHAWGENIGWLRFQGTAPDYSVRTVAFGTQPLGTPNWWLALHNVGESYDDGDNMSAWQEYVADTDPTNSASWFGIASISNMPSTRVYFPSSSRRFYTLQRRDDLQVGNWSNVVTQTGVQGSGGSDSLQDTGGAEAQFYRVKVSL